MSILGEGLWGETFRGVIVVFWGDVDFKDDCPWVMGQLERLLLTGAACS